MGKVSEAHASGRINSLLVVNDDVWSAADDGSIKCWNIQVLPLLCPFLLLLSTSILSLLFISFLCISFCFCLTKDLNRVGRVSSSQKMKKQKVVTIVDF